MLIKLCSCVFAHYAFWYYFQICKKVYKGTKHTANSWIAICILSSGYVTHSVPLAYPYSPTTSELYLKSRSVILLRNIMFAHRLNNALTLFVVDICKRNVAPQPKISEIMFMGWRSFMSVYITTSVVRERNLSPTIPIITPSYAIAKRLHFVDFSKVVNNSQ